MAIKSYSDLKLNRKSKSPKQNSYETTVLYRGIVIFPCVQVKGPAKYRDSRKSKRKDRGDANNAPKFEDNAVFIQSIPMKCPRKPLVDVRAPSLFNLSPHPNH